jgi:hypothetical protein
VVLTTARIEQNSIFSIKGIKKAINLLVICKKKHSLAVSIRNTFDLVIKKPIFDAF